MVQKDTRCTPHSSYSVQNLYQCGHLNPMGYHSWGVNILSKGSDVSIHKTNPRLWCSAQGFCLFPRVKVSVSLSCAWPWCPCPCGWCPHLQGDVLVPGAGQHGGDDAVGLPRAHQGLQQRPARRHADGQLVADVAARLKPVLLGHCKGEKPLNHLLGRAKRCYCP